MTWTNVIRGSSICTFCSRVVEPRAIAIRPCSLSPLQSQPQYLARTFTSLRTHLLPSLAVKNSQLPHKDELNTIAILNESIQRGLLDKESPPSETEVLLALQACQSYASLRLQASSTASVDVTPTSILLSLDEDPAKQSTKQPSPSSLYYIKEPGRLTAPPTETLATSPRKPCPSDFEPLTELAYKIISHPCVFITLPILASYVSLQSLIRDPSPIPTVFSLYANKPFTQPGSPKPRYPNPNQVKYAIPSNIASAALDAAIKAKDMSLCLDIIDTSYGTPAFQRLKLIRRATPVAIAGCLTPAAVYALADLLAGYQDEVDHSLAVKYAFAGMLAYVCFTGSIGMVALMTANDQMVRVTWIVGTPLRQRWLREGERAALDRVAQAWGFKEPNRRGFEEGEEWELLREVVNRKGMYLDNPTLMEGME